MTTQSDILHSSNIGMGKAVAWSHSESKAGVTLLPDSAKPQSYLHWQKAWVDWKVSAKYQL
jgi:hypothetical protein